MTFWSQYSALRLVRCDTLLEAWHLRAALWDRPGRFKASRALLAQLDSSIMQLPRPATVTDLMGGRGGLLSHQEDGALACVLRAPPCAQVLIKKRV